MIHSSGGSRKTKFAFDLIYYKVKTEVTETVKRRPRVVRIKTKAVIGKDFVRFSFKIAILQCLVTRRQFGMLATRQQILLIICEASKIRKYCCYRDTQIFYFLNILNPY